MADLSIYDEPTQKEKPKKIDLSIYDEPVKSDLSVYDEPEKPSSLKEIIKGTYTPEEMEKYGEIVSPDRSRLGAQPWPTIDEMMEAGSKLSEYLSKQAEKIKAPEALKEVFTKGLTTKLQKPEAVQNEKEIIGVTLDKMAQAIPKALASIPGLGKSSREQPVQTLLGFTPLPYIYEAGKAVKEQGLNGALRSGAVQENSIYALMSFFALKKGWNEYKKGIAMNGIKPGTEDPNIDPAKKQVIEKSVEGMSKDDLKALVDTAPEKGVAPENINILKSILNKIDLKPIEIAEAQKPEVLTPDPEAFPTKFMGKSETVTIPRKYKIKTNFAIVDINDIITPENEKFITALQDRDRSTAMAREQYLSIHSAPDPDILGSSPVPTVGAPVIGKDMMAEVGRHRLDVFNDLYDEAKEGNKESSEKIDKYKNELLYVKEKHGIEISKEQIDAMKKPMLVRIRDTKLTPEQRLEFCQLADRSVNMQLTAVERAHINADNLTEHDLRTLKVNEDGSVGYKANKDIIDRFFSKIPVNDKAQYFDPEGDLTSLGEQEFYLAVFSKAYPDHFLLEKLIGKDKEQNIRNIVSAYGILAPDVARLKGFNPNNDISGAMSRAANILSKIRQEGGKIDDKVKTYVNQPDLFSDPIEEFTQKAIVNFLHEKSGEAGGQASILGAFKNYIEAATQAPAEQMGLFGIRSKLEMVQQFFGGAGDIDYMMKRIQDRSPVVEVVTPAMVNDLKKVNPEFKELVNEPSPEYGMAPAINEYGIDEETGLPIYDLNESPEVVGLNPEGQKMIEDYMDKLDQAEKNRIRHYARLLGTSVKMIAADSRSQLGDVIVDYALKVKRLEYPKYARIIKSMLETAKADKLQRELGKESTARVAASLENYIDPETLTPKEKQLREYHRNFYDFAAKTGPSPLDGLDAKPTLKTRLGYLYHHFKDYTPLIKEYFSGGNVRLSEDQIKLTRMIANSDKIRKGMKGWDLGLKETRDIYLKERLKKKVLYPAAKELARMINEKIVTLKSQGLVEKAQLVEDYGRAYIQRFLGHSYNIDAQISKNFLANILYKGTIAGQYINALMLNVPAATRHVSPAFTMMFPAHPLDVVAGAPLLLKDIAMMTASRAVRVMHASAPITKTVFSHLAKYRSEVLRNPLVINSIADMYNAENTFLNNLHPLARHMAFFTMETAEYIKRGLCMYAGRMDAIMDKSLDNHPKRNQMIYQRGVQFAQRYGLPMGDMETNVYLRDFVGRMFFMYKMPEIAQANLFYRMFADNKKGFDADVNSMVKKKYLTSDDAKAIKSDYFGKKDLFKIAAVSGLVYFYQEMRNRYNKTGHLDVYDRFFNMFRVFEAGKPSMSTQEIYDYLQDWQRARTFKQHLKLGARGVEAVTELFMNLPVNPKFIKTGKGLPIDVVTRQDAAKLAKHIREGEEPTKALMEYLRIYKRPSGW